MLQLVYFVLHILKRREVLDNLLNRRTKDTRPWYILTDNLMQTKQHIIHVVKVKHNSDIKTKVLTNGYAITPP